VVGHRAEKEMKAVPCQPCQDPRDEREQVCVCGVTFLKGFRK
jgi:hypothetical protein